MHTKFANYVLSWQGRFAMPIGVYAGLEMTKATVRQAVSDAAVQTEAVLALHEYFKTPVMLTTMDLSAEAETFGCEIRMSDEEIPTVIGRRVTTTAEIAALPDPQPGDHRTRVHLATARKLVAAGDGTPVLGEVIGPFSLAGRLFGVSETLELTIDDPDAMEALLEKTTRFLTQYILAFRERGAQGVIMAEPAAGLLSPRALGRFSAAYVKRIVDAVQGEDFVLIYHNCGAKPPHLPKILEGGAEIYHFGAPMDIIAALQQVDGRVILAGNLDPTAVFHSGTPEHVQRETEALLKAAKPYRNYIVSSGCDIPPGTPLANLAAFYRSVAASG
jgi:uroporphyrinogen decarboxylase